MLTARRDMQGCFRKYPEVYGSELDSDADDDEDDLPADGEPVSLRSPQLYFLRKDRFQPRTPRVPTQQRDRSREQGD
jgi:hypothetical protein